LFRADYISNWQYNGESIFHKFRKECGGQYNYPLSEDSLIQFLQKLCIREYPNFLLSSISNNIGPAYPNVIITLQDYQEFTNLIKNDILDKITNPKTDLEYCFEFKTQNGLQIQKQVVTACNTLLVRAFHECCLRMNYSLDAVLNNIITNITILRDLAEGKEIKASGFIGIRGLRFDGFNEITFDGSVIRQFNGPENPCIHTQKTICLHADSHGKYSGHILEILHQTKILSCNTSVNSGYGQKAFEFQQNLLEKILFSFLFSSNLPHGPASVFSEISFPLLTPGSYTFSNQTSGNFLLINFQLINDIQNWFSKFHTTDIENIRIPLRRLKYAIFERKNPEDSILDAVIAWEGMFSGSTETTFRVTGSIAKYLKNSNERKIFYTRLKKLYQYRSKLAHGKKSASSKNEDPYKVSEEVINIGLECLKKLLQGESLLSLSPEDRVEKILILSD
jgi:hypothetical protein